jgi:hypothetical protein
MQDDLNEEEWERSHEEGGVHMNRQPQPDYSPKRQPQPEYSPDRQSTPDNPPEYLRDEEEDNKTCGRRLYPLLYTQPQAEPLLEEHHPQQQQVLQVMK